jgi:hypothetical protein
LVSDIKAGRCETNVPKTRPLCTSILNACDTSYFVIAQMGHNTLDRHYDTLKFRSAVDKNLTKLTLYEAFLLIAPVLKTVQFEQCISIDNFISSVCFYCMICFVTSVASSETFTSGLRTGQ